MRLPTFYEQNLIPNWGIVLHLKTDEMYLSDPYCIDCLQSGLDWKKYR